MTPEEFYLKMCTLLTKNGNDFAELHRDMDQLMCELLAELGYEKGVKVFENADKWYS